MFLVSYFLKASTSKNLYFFKAAILFLQELLFKNMLIFRTDNFRQLISFAQLQVLFIIY